MNKLLLVAAIGGLASISGAFAAYTGPKVELTYLNGFTGPDKPFMDTLIKQFNDSHPNISIKSQPEPWGTIWQQLPSLVAAGRAPDLVVINEDQVTGFIARGAISPLSQADLKAAGIDKARFYQPLFQTADYKGVSYGVPIASNVLAMYYNKDLMAKMGVTKVPTSRAEFISAGQKCTTDKAGKHPGEAGFDAANLATWGAGVPTPWMGGTIAYAVLRQNGVNLVDKNNNAAFNSPAAVDAVQFLVDLINKYNISPKNATEDSEITAFKQGKTCFNFNGNWRVEEYKSAGVNYGVIGAPRFGTKQNATWSGSSHITLPRQRTSYDKNKRMAALEFVNWLSQPAQDLYWTGAGNMPTMPAVGKDKSFDGKVIAGLFDALPTAYATTGYPWVGQVRGAWDGAIENAILGKKPVQKALDDGVNEANKNIAQVRESLGMK